MDNGAEINFYRYNVKELKDYLRTHGQHVGGKKQELIQRAMGTAELLAQRARDNGERGREPKGDGTNRTTQLEFVQSLKSWVNVDSVPVEHWPEITYTLLLDFLVFVKQSDGMEKKAHRQHKGANFYNSFHVHSVQFAEHPENNEQCFLKCSCMPSLPAADSKPHQDRHVWLHLERGSQSPEKPPEIVGTHCTCPAGFQGTCNHVSALLYCLVDVTEKKKEGLDASTSERCKWNNPRKRKLSPKKAEQLGRKGRDGAVAPTPASSVNFESLAAKLHACAPRSGWLVNFTAKDQPAAATGLPLTRNPPLVSYPDWIDLKDDSVVNHFENFLMNETPFSEEQRRHIEVSTRDQSNSKSWGATRKGRITASFFGDIMTRRETTEPDNLVKLIFQYTSFDKSSVRWGRTHEPAGRRAYQIRMKKTGHPSIEIRKSGLVIHPELPYVGCSPDGLVACHCCLPTQGLLEVKCPSSHLGKTPAELCEEKGFFCGLEDSKVVLKRSHKYFYQVQGQMGVTGLQWCDFVVWTPAGLSIERIHFDASVWSTLLQKIQSFYLKAVIPEIFTRRVLRKKMLYPK